MNGIFGTRGDSILEKEKKTKKEIEITVLR